MTRSTLPIALLVVAEVAAMSLWFTGAALLPGLQAEFALSQSAAGALTSLVQLGFVLGGLGLAVSGLADRFPPQRIFALSALIAGGANAVMLFARPDSPAVWASRMLVGAALAGVYPVGMTIASSFGVKNRGLLIGLLVGALTLGSALPHGARLLGIDDWRTTVWVTSGLGALAALLVLFVRLGPHHKRAARFNPQALRSAWRVRGVRLAYVGYLAHMWELYGFWAWIAAALALQMSAFSASAVTFAAIAVGGVTCVLGGQLADRIGRAEVTRLSLAASGFFALATAASLAWGPVALTGALAIAWGATVIPDSPQFSALVADHAPEGEVGSLLALQTALGFALTAVTVQVLPLVADAIGWPAALAVLAAGPAVGFPAMKGLLRAA